MKSLKNLGKLFGAVKGPAEATQTAAPAQQ